MKKFSELSMPAQLGIFLGVAVVIVVGGEFGYLQNMVSANRELDAAVKKLQADNDTVRPIEQKFRQIKVENEQLEQQLANLKTVVPDEKETDSFIRMVEEAGTVSGVEIRRFTARPLAVKDFYSEMPFEMDVDGTYNSVMQFFDKMGKLPRIINISNLALGPVTASAKGVRRRYAYAPNETIVGSCVATTFFSRETTAAAPPAKR